MSVVKKAILDEVADAWKRCGRRPSLVLVLSMREQLTVEALEVSRYCMAPSKAMTLDQITEELMGQYVGVPIRFSDEAIDVPFAVYGGRQ